MQRLTGGTVVPVGDLYMRRVLDAKRSRGLLVTTVDAGAVDLGTKAELVSGRWPTGDREIVATPYGISRGLADHGTVTLRYQGRAVEVTVVGVANSSTAGAASPTPSRRARWTSRRPSTGATSCSATPACRTPRSSSGTPTGCGSPAPRRCATHRPPSELPRDHAADADRYQSRDVQTALAVGGVMLLLVTTLLVAPAFAVSASRQRRTLALAASNGAETRQLRRKVLAQALLLGALAAVVSAGARRPGRPGRDVGARGAAPVDHLPLLRGPVVGARPRSSSWLSSSALVAALIPALRLRRLDIIGVMKGQSVSPRVNRILPVIGAVLAVGGGVGLVAAVATRQREIAIAGCAIALTVGALMLVPIVLVLAGILASRLPVAARMATRDAARHRTRSVPTVAAIMAGTIALTIFSIGLASDSEQQRREYRPQQLTGEGMPPTAVYEGPGSDDPGPRRWSPTEELMRVTDPRPRDQPARVRHREVPRQPPPTRSRSSRRSSPAARWQRAVKDTQFGPTAGRSAPSSAPTARPRSRCTSPAAAG